MFGWVLLVKEHPRQYHGSGFSTITLYCSHNQCHPLYLSVGLMLGLMGVYHKAQGFLPLKHEPFWGFRSVLMSWYNFCRVTMPHCWPMGRLAQERATRWWAMGLTKVWFLNCVNGCLRPFGKMWRPDSVRWGMHVNVCARHHLPDPFTIYQCSTFVHCFYTGLFQYVGNL